MDAGRLGGHGIICMRFFYCFYRCIRCYDHSAGGFTLPGNDEGSLSGAFHAWFINDIGEPGSIVPAEPAHNSLRHDCRSEYRQSFLAGLLPGFLLILLLSLYSVYKGSGRKVEREPFSWGRLGKAVKEAGWEIPMPFIIIIGIYGGFVTATEAAAVVAFYILVVEVFVYRDLGMFRDVPRIMCNSMVLVGSILVIMGLALGLTGYLTDEEIPQKILMFMNNYITGKIMFLVVLNIFLLIVGFLMDIFSAMFVIVPLILPIAAQFGVNPVHLGIIFLTNLEIGYSTPPVGLNLFIASFRFDKPVIQLYRAALPFIVIMLVALLLITYIPALSLQLVDWFGRN